MRKLGLLLLVVACGSSQPKPAPPPDLVSTAPVPQPTPAVVEAPKPAPPVEEATPLDPAIKKATLPNGLTYYVMKHEKPEQRAQLWLAVNAGSVQEDDDQRGLAHFVEHMAFNGTKRFPKNDIIKYLERIGRRLCGRRGRRRRGRRRVGLRGCRRLR